MTNEPILHLCEKYDWDLAQKSGEYYPASLLDEGFIHCSTPDQLMEVANGYYPDNRNLFVLVIDPQYVKAEIKWERVDEGIFPHIYGVLNVNAVIAVHPMFIDEDGVFRRHPLSEVQG